MFMLDRLNVIFRKTQADVDNAVAEARQKRAAYNVLLACYSSGIQSASCLQQHMRYVFSGVFYGQIFLK